MSADAQKTSDRFRESLGLTFPLVGDPDGSIGRAYGVRWPVIGLFKRATYVVGRDRRIELAFRSERDPEAHVEQACRLVLGKGRGRGA